MEEDHTSKNKIYASMVFRLTILNKNVAQFNKENFHI